MNHPDEENLQLNVKDLIENIHEHFTYFINDSGVFLSSFIISNSETKDRKTLLKEFIGNHAEKSNNL